MSLDRRPSLARRDDSTLGRGQIRLLKRWPTERPSRTHKPLSHSARIGVRLEHISLDQRLVQSLAIALS